MSEFEPISLKHKALFEETHAAEPNPSSGDSFGCVYLWDLRCRRNIARLGDRIGIEYMCPNGIFYAFPSGAGDLVSAVEALRSRAASRGIPLKLWGLTPDKKKALEEAFPGCFEYTDDRDNYDYVHDINSIADLGGKKLHGKRNFCNRFEKSFQWSFVPLSPERFEDCRGFLAEWDQEKEGGDPEENLAIERVFREWDSLDMSGGVLYADGRIMGFTIAERITEDMLDVHFEKARADVPGAYPMLAREFARLIRGTMPGIRYLNREEDMGQPNLRKAKTEWYPLYLLEKTTAVWRDGQ